MARINSNACHGGDVRKGLGPRVYQQSESQAGSSSKPQVTCFPVHSGKGFRMAGGKSFTRPTLSVSPRYTSSMYCSRLKKHPRMLVIKKRTQALLQPSKMPKGQKAKEGKKVAPGPAIMKKKEAKKVMNPLFEKKPKNFGIGRDTQPQRDLTRFVKWPRYIRLQRQRAILYKRLKVPPAINQFTQALDRQTTTQLLKLVHKYRPETKEKKQRLLIALRRKLLAKGTSQLRDHLSFEQGSPCGWCQELFGHSFPLGSIHCTQGCATAILIDDHGGSWVHGSFCSWAINARSFRIKTASFMTACKFTVWPLVNIWSPSRLTGRYLQCDHLAKRFKLPKASARMQSLFIAGEMNTPCRNISSTYIEEERVVHRERELNVAQVSRAVAEVLYTGSSSLGREETN
ncbi:hypothetical protein A6R68_23387 [Neotoma lepida]|uniref:60S ribosomal protein L7a n=1 Tax=Neotoma lepida TaxID=56216 RepID=A0A1A6HY27_NEOLE|nr:hypothetical protein A6R68_23387 [Neotoma lepida]